MQPGKQRLGKAERGVSLSGLIFGLAVISVVAVFAMKVLPSYFEFRSVKNAIEKAKEAGGSAGAMKATFDKYAEIDNVSAVRGRDLVISKDTGETELSFAYEKRIPLVGNASLVIDYAGTTDKSGVAAATTASAQQ
jgi:hypothetical protein